MHHYSSITQTPTWQVQEQAEYRLLTLGTDTLSDRELVGVILGDQEAAVRLFVHFQSLATLSRASTEELAQQGKMSYDLAQRLSAAFAAGRRSQEVCFNRLSLRSSEQVAAYLIPKLAHKSQEVFYVIYLSRNNEIIHEEALFIGGISSTVVDLRIIFKRAISHLATALIVAHNHPSGNTKPSKADIAITHKLVASAKYLDLRILDHLIISNRGHFSFADEGMLEA